MIEFIIIAVIIAFGVYTYRVGRDIGGYVPFIRSVMSTGPSRQVVVDLYISTTILCIWMIYDALEVGISMAWVTLYIVIAVFMASFGPLFYLLHRFLVLG